jgi:hypothetical protein
MTLACKPSYLASCHCAEAATTLFLTSLANSWWPIRRKGQRHLANHYFIDQRLCWYHVSSFMHHHSLFISSREIASFCWCVSVHIVIYMLITAVILFPSYLSRLSLLCGNGS